MYLQALLFVSFSRSFFNWLLLVIISNNTHHAPRIKINELLYYIVIIFTTITHTHHQRTTFLKFPQCVIQFFFYFFHCIAHTLRALSWQNHQWTCVCLSPSNPRIIVNHGVKVNYWSYYTHTHTHLNNNQKSNNA